MSTLPPAATVTPPLLYQIDADDCLIYLGPAWAQLAASAGGLGGPETYLGRKLWTCIGDADVNALYRRLVRRARDGRPVLFSYRCDSPTHRRTFKMQITARPHGVVEFLTMPESVAAFASLARPGRTGESASTLTMCSVCQRVELPVNYWLPIEEAVEFSSLMAAESAPRLVPKLCPTCARIGE